MREKSLLMVIGGVWHPFDRCAAIVKHLLESTGRYTISVTNDLNTFRSGSINKFDGVVVYTGGGELRKDQESGLVNFVKSGGSLIGVHCAAASFEKSAAYVDMLGGTFATHGPCMEFPVTLKPSECMITKRIPDFRVTDELYILDKFQANGVEVLATAMWKNKPQPMAYTKTFGKGKVFFLALGHDERALMHPEFQKMLRRGVDWTFGRTERKPLKAGVIGYGKSFKMGKLHLESMRDAAGFEIVAVCDLVEQRLIEAREEFPYIQTYRSAAQMLAQSGVELVTVITEHNVHAKLAIQCLNAGCNVITEKPFCVTVKEADAMIAAARKHRRMLSVFHNRRWDGDYMAIKDVIARGMIGDVFQIEATMGGYGHPSYWWRSDKRISGGAFYDWGAHVVDWTLGLVPAPVTEVCGHFQEKRVWHDVTNEDHCATVLRFANGCSAHIELSNIAAIKKPRWRILGTLGGILDWDDDKLEVVSYNDGIRLDSQVAYRPSDWHAYYRNVADHLLLDEPLAVTPESARRVIAVIQTSELSTRANKALPIPKHCA
jgi:predicted dehydrogenase/type 1 glutamine amidotransferase